MAPSLIRTKWTQCTSSGAGDTEVAVSSMPLMIGCDKRHIHTRFKRASTSWSASKSREGATREVVWYRFCAEYVGYRRRSQLLASNGIGFANRVQCVGYWTSTRLKGLRRTWIDSKGCGKKTRFRVSSRTNHSVGSEEKPSATIILDIRKWLARQRACNHAVRHISISHTWLYRGPWGSSEHQPILASDAGGGSGSLLTSRPLDSGGRFLSGAD